MKLVALNLKKTLQWESVKTKTDNLNFDQCSKGLEHFTNLHLIFTFRKQPLEQSRTCSDQAAQLYKAVISTSGRPLAARSGR
jgi:hypothetical protein